MFYTYNDDDDNAHDNKRSSDSHKYYHKPTMTAVKSVAWILTRKLLPIETHTILVMMMMRMMKNFQCFLSNPFEYVTCICVCASS